MTTLEINVIVNDVLDSRGLKNPRIRKNALKNVLAYIETAFQKNDVKLPRDKESLKVNYARFMGYDINSAESSVINTIYQYCPGAIQK